MTPAELAALRDRFGAGPDTWAALLGRSERTIRRWESGAVVPGLRDRAILRSLATVPRSARAVGIVSAVGAGERHALDGLVELLGLALHPAVQ